jgi:glyoxylase-like metal-dependent hydrolase (beta-lactamase superfamily II)
MVIAPPITVAPGTFCLETEYPEVADAPLWIYLLRDSSGRAALVDCGVPSTYDRVLAAALPALSVEPADLAWLLLTHGHPDHMGGHSGLRRRASFGVAAPLEDTAWVESVARQWHDFWDCFPGSFSLEAERDGIVGMCGGDLAVDRVLRDGDVFELGERRLEVVLTRGHTRGHCAFFERETGLLLGGDSVQGYGTPASSGSSVFAPLYDDVDDYLWGLERLRELPFAHLCLSHRPPLGRDEGLALIERSIDFVHHADRVVLDLLDRAQAPVALAQAAAALGELCGTTPPVTIQTVYTAHAHLGRAARAGLVEPRWAPAGGGG